MPAHRFLIGLLFLSTAAQAQSGTPQERFARDLADIREQTYVTPNEALRQLGELKKGRGIQELGQVLVETSRAYYALGDKDKAVDVALQAERIGRELHDDALLASAMLSHAYALSKYVHDQQAARQLIQGAAQLAVNTRDPYLQTQALVTRGLLAEEDGATAEGLDLVTRAASLARFSEDKDALSMALRQQARLLASVGDYQEALALSDELIGLARRRGIAAQLAYARLSEYATAALAGDSRRAEAALEAAVELLEKLHARERLAVPLANLAELYIQARRFGEAARTSEAALRIAREVGDGNAAQLASFQLGIASIYFRDTATGKALVDQALDAMKNDERYVRMLLDYGHALNQVGEGGVAMRVYEKAGSASLAAWRKEKQLSYESMRRAYDNQKKRNELAALHHESALRAAELENERRLRTLWVLLSAITFVAVCLIAVLYRRVAKANGSLKQKNEQLFRQSTRDSLTGLFNRHYFYEQVVPRHHGKADPRVDPHGGYAEPERRAGADEKTGGVFLLLDVDHFKSINDGHGHSAGDLVLKSVAARLSATLREEDVLIRWGGEEFLAYLPGVGADGARQICERVLAAVSGAPIAVDERQLGVTISIGFCPKPWAGGDIDPDWEQLVHLADLCLYLAKKGGRNQAFGIGDASVLSPAVIAAADADIGKAAAEGLLELVNVRAGGEAVVGEVAAH